MQHANKTVSQGNRSNIGHEEKHWLAVMQTLDVVPWRAHFSGKKTLPEDPGQFHHSKEQVHLSALPSEEKSWITWNSHQI